MKVKLGLFLLVVMLSVYFSYGSSVLADGNDPVRITDQSMVVFPIDGEHVQVVQIMTFKNNGSAKEKELSIYLPASYSKLEIQQGLAQKDIKTAEKGITDTTGLDPGKEKKVVISYFMPLKNNTSQWSIEQSYATDLIEVIIPVGAMSFEATGLTTQSQLLQMNGQDLRQFTRLDVHPGNPWTLSFRVLDTASAQGSAQPKQPVSTPANTGSEKHYTSDGKKIYGHVHGAGISKAIFTLIVIFLALAIAVVGLRRERFTRKRNRDTDRPWLLSEKSALFQQIGQLERDYTSQLISQGIYHSARKQIREQLIRIAKELRGKPG